MDIVQRVPRAESPRGVVITYAEGVVVGRDEDWVGTGGHVHPTKDCSVADLLQTDPDKRGIGSPVGLGE
jgi:hypothetical protein